MIDDLLDEFTNPPSPVEEEYKAVRRPREKVMTLPAGAYLSQQGTYDVDAMLDTFTDPQWQERELEQTSKSLAGQPGESMVGRIGRRAIPGLSALVSVGEDQEFRDNLELFKKGMASRDQVRRLAEYMQRRGDEESRSFGGKMLDAALGVPAIIGEAAATGGASIPFRAGVGEFAKGVGKRAIQAQLMPSMTLKGASERSVANESSLIAPENLLPSAGMSAMMNVVLGTLGRVASGVQNPVSRFLAKTGIGAAEMEAVEVTAGFLDEFLPEIYRTHTRYGSIGSFVRSLRDNDSEEAVRGAEKLGLNLFTMGLFVAAHGNPGDARKMVKDVQDSLNESAKKGLPKDKAADIAQREVIDRMIEDFRSELKTKNQELRARLHSELGMSDESKPAPPPTAPKVTPQPEPLQPATTTQPAKPSATTQPAEPPQAIDIGSPLRIDKSMKGESRHHYKVDIDGKQVELRVIPRSEEVEVEWMGFSGRGTKERGPESLRLNEIKKLAQGILNNYPEAKRLTAVRLAAIRGDRRMTFVRGKSNPEKIEESPDRPIHEQLELGLFNYASQKPGSVEARSWKQTFDKLAKQNPEQPLASLEEQAQFLRGQLSRLIEQLENAEREVEVQKENKAMGLTSTLDEAHFHRRQLTKTVDNVKRHLGQIYDQIQIKEAQKASTQPPPKVSPKQEPIIKQPEPPPPQSATPEKPPPPEQPAPPAPSAPPAKPPQPTVQAEKPPVPSATSLGIIQAKRNGRTMYSTDNGKTWWRSAEVARRAPTNYEEFSQEYQRIFREWGKYSPNEIGFAESAKNLADLTENYPDWNKQFEESLELEWPQRTPVESQTPSQATVESLTPREQKVWDWLNGPNPLTLAEVGKRLGVTRERVRQISNQIREKLGLSGSAAEEHMAERYEHKRLPSSLAKDAGLSRPLADIDKPESEIDKLADEFMNLVKNKGDKLSDQEVQELMARFDPKIAELESFLSSERKKHESRGSNEKTTKSLVRSGKEGGEVEGLPEGLSDGLRAGQREAEQNATARAAEDAGQPGLMGSETLAVVPGSDPVPARYEIRELESARASHQCEPNGYLRARQDYPSNVQPRNYADQNESMKVDEIRLRMIPSVIINNHPAVSEGPPTITKGGTVLHGNGRQMGLEGSVFTGEYEKYKQELVANAERFGFDPNAVAAMKHPVLYRVVDMDPFSPEAAKFAAAGAQSMTMSQSPVRTAASLGKIITRDLLDSLRIESEETFSEVVTGSRGREFRQRLRDNLPPQEVPRYLTSNNDLTEPGVDFVRDMLITKVFPVELVERMGEESRSLKKALEGSVPQLIGMMRDYPDGNVVPQLEEAIRVLLRNPEIDSLEDANRVLGAASLFGGQVEPISPGGRMMLDFILENRNDRNQQQPVVFRKKMGEYIRELSGKSGLFADEDINPVDLAAAVFHVQKRPGAQFGEKTTRFGMGAAAGTFGIPGQSPFLSPIADAPYVPEKEFMPPGGPTWGRRFLDFIASFANKQFPEATRADPEVSIKMSSVANAKNTAKADWNYFSRILRLNNKPLGELSEDELRLAGATWLESRLRYYRDQLMQTDPLAAYDIVTLVGGADSPLRTEADYQNALNAMQWFFNAVMQEWTPYVENNFKKIRGMAPNQYIDVDNQIPGLPINAIAVEAGSPNAVKVKGGSRGQGLENLRLRKPSFMMQASLTGEAYDVNLRHMMQRTLEMGVPAAARADLVRTAISRGLMIDMQGQPPQPGWEELPVKVLSGMNIQKSSRYAVPSELYDEFVQSLGIGKRPAAAMAADLLKPVFDKITRVALLSPVELATHISNHITSLFRPGMGFPIVNLYTSIRNMIDITNQRPEILDRIRDLSKIAASFNHEPHGGILGERFAKFDPTAWVNYYTSRFIDTMQKAVRVQLSDAYRRVARNPTEAGERDFINQALGTYEPHATNRLRQFLKDSGLQPFAEAAHTFTVQGVKSLVGATNIKADNWSDAVRLRAISLAKLIPVLAIGPALNTIIWGDPAPPGIPFGAIKTREDDREETHFFDPLRFTGQRRGARAVGISALVEGVRENKALGEIIDRGGRDFLLSIEHLLAGPAAEFIHTLITGENAVGRKVAKQVSTAHTLKGQAKARLEGRPEPGSSQMVENLKAALLGINPFTEAAYQHDISTLYDHLMRAIGPFGEQTRKKPEKSKGLRR